MDPKYSPSLSTTDPYLAGFLASYYVPPDPRGFETSFNHEGRTLRQWHFSPHTKTGEQTAALTQGWKDPGAFNAADPLHPFSFYMVALQNAKALLQRCADRSPVYLIEKGPKIALVDTHAPRGVQDTILQKLGV